MRQGQVQQQAAAFAAGAPAGAMNMGASQAPAGRRKVHRRKGGR